MNIVTEMIVRDINNRKDSKSPKVKLIKEKTDEKIKTIKKNNSTDNFMKFQWSWTL